MLLVVLGGVALVCGCYYKSILTQYYLLRVRAAGADAAQGRRSGAGFFVKVHSGQVRGTLPELLGYVNRLSKYDHVLLDLSGTEVENADLELLTAVEGEITVDVSDTGVNRDGLEHLISVKNLAGVRVKESQVPAQVLADFWRRRAAARFGTD